MKVLYVTFAGVLLDVITKLFVKGFSLPFLSIEVSGMTYGSSIQLIGDFFRFTFVENPGMAFGIRIIEKEYLTLFVIVATVGLIIYLYKIRNESFWLRMPLALILAGAIGNLINRLFFGVLFGHAPLLQGNVVDFIDVDFFDFQIIGYSITRWPVFNFADVFVTLGVVMLLSSGNFSRMDKASESKEQNATIINNSTNTKSYFF
jgi:signal peptidase II